MNAGEASSLRGRLQWYATAAVGPMASAGVQFLLSLTLLARLPVAEFGRLSFVFVVSQFSVGIWSALFTSPMLVLSAQAASDGGGAEAARELGGVTAVSVWALLPATLLFAAIAAAVGLAPLSAGLFSLYASVVLLRQFARVGATARGAYGRAMTSDLAYSALLLAGVIALAVLPEAGEVTALAMLAFAVAGALAPLLPGVRLRLPGMSRVRAYRTVWSRDARWSLLGVISTEATVNSHSYIVTALLGPSAFAPIAATVLFIRPVTVAVNALVEFERARAAHRVARAEFTAIAQARLHLRLLLLAVWTGTAILAALVIAFAPAEYMVGKFGLETVLTGTGLWLAVAMARLLHAPEGVILLAAGRFRQLAWISGWTALVSLAAVLGLVAVASPVLSIAGIVLGEGAFAFAAWRATTRLLHDAPVPR
ncbi:putative peptidoglycan lipid II flippase [Novosphingobium chloroacetimidivorans]|uniref:Putative peptidoglycan lipid II flippase n=1 Tax=Novosphingobium chloroacetimidivorans TaxID=1428314 RepID=A0A7W7K6N5_9SPHN|nr:hypothetical protein [Novosphingobium chloroacetimidivorans]MBB4857249.1 putative peptidoglycan lipid II flippase [Novosphingobium chloroacetimidivorans]